MKKICFLIPGLNAGGIENFLLRFINFFPEKYGITVVVRSGKKGDLYHEYIDAGVKLRFQGVGFFNPVKWIKMYYYLKDQQFETVCDFNGNFAGTTLLLSRLAGIKNRIAFYRRSSNAFKQTWGRMQYNKAMNWLVYKHATKIFSNSQHAIDFFFPNRMPSDRRFKVIPNGLAPEIFNIKQTKEDARAQFNLPQTKFIVGHVGRYDPAKNHETIFKVAQKLKIENDNIAFLFAGRDTDGPGFSNKLKEYGIADFCFCLGLQSNLPLLYKSMDLFYFPSVTEGQPNALIEAMMAGLPIVASDIPPIKEVIPENFQAEVLAAPLDVDDHSKKIIWCFDNPDKNIRLEDVAKVKFNASSNFKIFLNEL